MGSNIKFIIASLNITLKRYLEYKVNLWSSIIVQLIWVITNFLFLIVIANNFGLLINWKIEDFLLFFLLTNLSKIIIGLFTWKPDLFQLIITGKLNTFLTKPQNTLLYTSFDNLSTPNITFILSSIILIPTCILYYNIEIHNILLGSFLIILITFMNFFMISFFEATNFFSKGLRKGFYNTFEKGYQILELYPSPFFNDAKFKTFLLIFSYFYIGVLLIPVIRNYDIINFKLQLTILISITIIFFISTIISWHYGLRRYEAFG